MSDYHVLVVLSEAPGQRLRMGELASRLVFSPSRLTYQISSMVKRGLVRKQSCPDDRRGQEAVLTDAGLAGAARPPPRCTSTTVRDTFIDRPRRRRARRLTRVFDGSAADCADAPSRHRPEGAAMPAITVDDVLVLPRLPQLDPATTSLPAGPPADHRAQRLRGRGLPGPPGLRRRADERARPVHPPGPDGRGGLRAGRAEGHPVAPAPRLRDGHLHDRRRSWTTRTRNGGGGIDHQRRHPVDDRRRRHPAHRGAAGAAGHERRPVPRPAALGEPAAGRPR